MIANQNSSIEMPISAMLWIALSIQLFRLSAAKVPMGIEINIDNIIPVIAR